MITLSLSTAVALALATALTAGAAAPARSGPSGTHWSPDLRDAERSGVVVDSGGARLDPAARPSDRVERLGLLTLPAHRVEDATDRVVTAITGDVPEGSSATVDVRGRTAHGWTEWVPSESGTVTLPEPTTQVQGRLVLTGTSAAQPVVRALDLTAERTSRHRITVAKRPVLGYRVFATREGLVGGTTANGHVIGEDDLFVALPSRRALSPRGTGDYSVRVCVPSEQRSAARCAYAPVWDVGPWNTRDDYWNPPNRREQWNVLAQGVPQAQAAHLLGFNDGRDQFGRKVLNPAGIDLSDAVFLDVLGLDDNSWVTVDYLWTGSGPLATVTPDEPVEVRAAPDEDATVVGLAAGRARVPAACVTDADDRWLRMGDGQYLPAAAANVPAGTPSCPDAQDGPEIDPALPPVIELPPVIDPTPVIPAVPATPPDEPATPGRGLADELARIDAEIRAATEAAQEELSRSGTEPLGQGMP